MFQILLNILFSLLVVSGLGFILGLCLAFFAAFFKVDSNSKVESIVNILPGTNCGVCGFAGCQGYAEALVKNETDINLCLPGDVSIIEKIGAVLDKTATPKLKYVAKVFCLGDDSIAVKDYIFNGEDDCTVVHSYFSGDKACKYGCLGRGSCIKVCPVNAIKRDDYNRVWIDANLCIGCSKCINICPPKVIKLVPVNGGYFVACSSHDDGDTVKEICKKGCIACKNCENESSTARINVQNNLARINYKSNIDLYNAAVKCPADVIVPINNQIEYMMDNKNNKKEIEI